MTTSNSPTGMSAGTLVRLLRDFAPSYLGPGDLRFRAVHQDSRQVEPGSLFVARAGRRAFGGRFVEQAAHRGALAVLAGDGVELPSTLPVIRVSQVEPAAALAAEAVYGWPSRALRLVGVTGTNGKTTVAWLLQQALTLLGMRCGRLGTLGSAFEAFQGVASLTTPQSDEVSRTLARMRREGATHVVMEVSSVALEQHRVAALSFDVAALTNLTRDHLDDHGSMEAYAQAKARLFRELSPAHSLLNVDCALGEQLQEELGKRALGVSRAAGSDIDYGGLGTALEGLSGSLRLRGSECTVHAQLLGAHNAQNLAFVLGICLALGFPVGQLEAVPPHLKPAPGRLEACHEAGSEVHVVVDYAHTPDALVSALDALRPMVQGRLLCVFGCGGDRDPGKRRPMARAVAQGADYAIVTNDNPRSEEPAAIAEEMEQGFPKGYAFERILNRRLAIERAVQLASPGDWVLIAGKGHETYQETAGKREPFDDRVVARSALAARQSAVPGAVV